MAWLHREKAHIVHRGMQIQEVKTTLAQCSSLRATSVDKMFTEVSTYLDIISLLLLLFSADQPLKQCLSLLGALLAVKTGFSACLVDYTYEAFCA